MTLKVGDQVRLLFSSADSADDIFRFFCEYEVMTGEIVGFYNQHVIVDLYLPVQGLWRCVFWLPVHLLVEVKLK